MTCPNHEHDYSLQFCSRCGLPRSTIEAASPTATTKPALAMSDDQLERLARAAYQADLGDSSERTFEERHEHTQQYYRRTVAAVRDAVLADLRARGGHGPGCALVAACLPPFRSPHHKTCDCGWDSLDMLRASNVDHADALKACIASENTLRAALAEVVATSRGGGRTGELVFGDSLFAALNRAAKLLATTPAKESDHG